MKKKPSIADELNAALASPHKHFAVHGLWSNSQSVAKRVIPLMRKAVLFKLSDDIVEAACRLALDHPDVLAELSRRARLPYDVVFLEWSNFHKLKVCEGRWMPNTPEHVGALLRRGHDAEFSWCTVSPSAEAKQSIGLGPFETTFNPDLDAGSHTGEAHAFIREIVASPSAVGSFCRSVPDSVEQEFYHHRGMIPWIYGNSPWYGQEPNDLPLQWESARDISRRTRIKLSPYSADDIKKGLKSDEFIRVQVAEHAGGGVAQGRRDQMVERQLRDGYIEELGDAKVIIAVISLLSAGTKVVEIGDLIPGEGSSYAAGRLVKYMASRVIRLKLPMKETRRTLRAMAYRMRKRRHEVMGHWCASHRVGDPMCEHKYEDTSPTSKVCNKCQHRIWYKKSYERGDASIGFVRHSYVVEHA